MSKNQRVLVRMTQLELDILHQMCVVEARNAPEMLRELIREGAKRRGLWVALQTVAAPNVDPAKENRTA